MAQSLQRQRSEEPIQMLNGSVDCHDFHLHRPGSGCIWDCYVLWMVDANETLYNSRVQADRFGSILLFIIPCNGIVFVHLMGGLTMIIGMALGWAWGVISMKAALATRPAAETNARLAQLAAEAQRQQTNTEQATGQSQYTQVLIFEGFMLDTRVTITYFCMLGLFIYLVVSSHGEPLLLKSRTSLKNDGDYFNMSCGCSLTQK